MTHLRFLLFVCCLPLMVFSKSSEYLSHSYRIVSSVRDESLSFNEAVFEFRFLNAVEEHQPVSLVKASFNGILQDLQLTGSNHSHTISVEPGTYFFKFFLDGRYEEVFIRSLAIQPGFKTVVEIDFQPAEREIMLEKPVIYLYPEQATDVAVTLKTEGALQFTYPVYKEGWQLNATPDGTLHAGGKSYPYLFWDAQFAIRNLPLQPGKGVVLHRDAVIPFLEQQLSHAGLNHREQADFITYWGPRLTASERVLLQFAWGENCDRFAELHIAPQPEHINRLYVLWTPLQKEEELPFNVTAQELPAFDRSGFDVLEWGGMEIPVTELNALN